MTLRLALVLAISLRVSPLIGVAPSVIRAQAHLDLVPSDRKVTLVIESETFYASTECELTRAEQSSRLCPSDKPLEVYVRLPGIYWVTASVGSWSVVRATDRQMVEIR